MERLGIGGQGSREGVLLYLFILISCTVEEEGPEVEGLGFSPSLDVQRGGEGGLVFFLWA